MEPKSTVELGESEAGSLLRLLDALEEQDDVDGVHANFDISDEVMEKALRLRSEGIRPSSQNEFP